MEATTIKAPGWTENPVLCIRCGGTNVHVMMWVNTYTGQIDWTEPALDLYSDPRESGLTASWCMDCDADHGTILPSDLAPAVELLAVLCGKPSVACGYCSIGYGTIAEAEECCREWLDGEE